MKNKKGFTLTELMTVVLIIGTLAAIAYPLYSRSIVKARLADAISLIEIVRSAQQRNFVRTNPNAYFEKFTNAHITGDTRIIKSSGLSITNNGSLKKGLYAVSMKDPVSNQYNPHSCISVSYGEDVKLFQIEALVEDSKIYCAESNLSSTGICDMISDKEANHLCQ